MTAVTRIRKKEDCKEEIVGGVTSDGIRVVGDKELQQLQKEAKSNKKAFEVAKGQIKNAGADANGLNAGITKAHFLFDKVDGKGKKIGGVIAKVTGVVSCRALVGSRDKYHKEFKQDSFKWGVGNGRLWECVEGTSKYRPYGEKMPYHGKRYWIEMITVATSNGEFANVRTDPSSKDFNGL